MATVAQIAANQRNAERSTGPRTEEGKLRARCNALKHGLTATVVRPLLPQEDPAELEERVQQWLADMQPRTAVERKLVEQAAHLSWDIERAKRIETAHLAGLVREATGKRNQQISTRRLEEVRELGRKLLYIDPPEDVKVPRTPLWADDPELLVSKLEATAEGCRWLVQRWAEFRNLLDHKSRWEQAVLLRFVRLQGKNLCEAVYDPRSIPSFSPGTC